MLHVRVATPDDVQALAEFIHLSRRNHDLTTYRDRLPHPASGPAGRCDAGQAIRSAPAAAPAPQPGRQSGRGCYISSPACVNSAWRAFPNLVDVFTLM